MSARAPAPSGRFRLSRGRRYLVRGLLAGATVLAIVGIFAVWANRQVLHANNWADTSTALLQNHDIRTQVSALLVDQVYANVDVNKDVTAGLPPRLKPLAAPVANGLRTAAERATVETLGRPRVQEAWKAANRATAQQFIDIADGNSKAITSSGNAVFLDLRPLVLDVVARLGLPGKVAAKLPPNAGHVKIMSGNQVKTVQNGTTFLRGLAVVLPLVAAGMLALAVFLARGRRRETLLWAGLNLIAAGLIVLVARSLIGDQVVGSLVKTDGVKPAADAVWSIGTHMLRDVAEATIVAGIPVVAAAWLAGPMRSATALRHAIAPWLRDRPATAYTVLFTVLLLVIAWGPIPATRMVVPVLLLIGLSVLGLEALRRQTALEFPDARAGWAGTQLRGMRGATASDEHQTTAPAGQGGNGPAAAVAEQTSRLDQLERLVTLHDHGVLTDAEFAAEKSSLLANRVPT
jgi:hypothetical protein